MNVKAEQICIQLDMRGGKIGGSPDICSGRWEVTPHTGIQLHKVGNHMVGLHF